MREKSILPSLCLNLSPLLLLLLLFFLPLPLLLPLLLHTHRHTHFFNQTDPSGARGHFRRRCGCDVCLCDLGACVFVPDCVFLCVLKQLSGRRGGGGEATDINAAQLRCIDLFAAPGRRGLGWRQTRVFVCVCVCVCAHTLGLQFPLILSLSLSPSPLLLHTLKHARTHSDGVYLHTCTSGRRVDL